MIIAVTNRHLCKGDFYERIRLIASKKPFGIILREKDMNIDDYTKTAVKCNEICREYNVPLIINTFIDAAEETGIKNIQLSYSDFKKNHENICGYNIKCASVHSPSEAREMQAMGADFVIAGHVFETDCKPGLKPRGTEFLRSVVNSVDIPVFAIGGISPENISSVMDTKAAGGCIMSYSMNGENLNFIKDHVRY